MFFLFFILVSSIGWAEGPDDFDDLLKKTNMTRVDFDKLEKRIYKDEPKPYSRAGRFGVRITAGAGAYVGGISNTPNKQAIENSRINLTGVPSADNKASFPDYTKYLSAGWQVPLQLEATYGLTNAFEILLGGRYGITNPFTGADKYILRSIGAALGFRYYLEHDELIQAYVACQLAMDLNEFVHVEGKSTVGFLFRITHMIGIFTEANIALAGLYGSTEEIGKGGQLSLGLGTGLQLRF